MIVLLLVCEYEQIWTRLSWLTPRPSDFPRCRLTGRPIFIRWKIFLSSLLFHQNWFGFSFLNWIMYCRYLVSMWLNFDYYFKLFVKFVVVVLFLFLEMICFEFEYVMWLEYYFILNSQEIYQRLYLITNVTYFFYLYFKRYLFVIFSNYYFII